MLRSALAKRPEDRFATYALALELARGEGAAEAETLLEALVARHPHSGAAWLQWARLRDRRGDTAGAAEVLRQGLAALSGAEGAEASRARAELAGELAALGED
jgi:thioredoxin-like negative regulator of GroEL